MNKIIKIIFMTILLIGMSDPGLASSIKHKKSLHKKHVCHKKHAKHHRNLHKRKLSTKHSHSAKTKHPRPQISDEDNYQEDRISKLFRPASAETTGSPSTTVSPITNFTSSPAIGTYAAAALAEMPATTHYNSATSSRTSSYASPTSTTMNDAYPSTVPTKNHLYSSAATTTNYSRPPSTATTTNYSPPPSTNATNYPPPSSATSNSFSYRFPINFAASMEERLVDFVKQSVETLRYSSYKFGGSHIDTNRGIYIVDCSSYVDYTLKSVYPQAYFSLVDSSGTDKPNSLHYYDFFKGLTYEPDNYWNKIEDVEQLQPGDILVFRYKNKHRSSTRGHVMVVMNKPMRQGNDFLVNVADSAPEGHSQDTRLPHESGVGIGNLLLKVNPKTGQPSAYAWKVGSHWKHNVNFAMARPNDVFG